MIDIKVQPLASGKIKIHCKIYELLPPRSKKIPLYSLLRSRYGLYNVLKRKLYGRKIKTNSKKLIFNEYLHLNNHNNEENLKILQRWIEVKNLQNYKDLILKKYEEHLYIYETGNE